MCVLLLGELGHSVLFYLLPNLILQVVKSEIVKKLDCLLNLYDVYAHFPLLCVQRTYITREIVATDGGNRSSSVELAVTITNVKNQPPQWEKDTYSVVIQENTVRDTPIVVCWPADMLLGTQSINTQIQCVFQEDTDAHV